MLTRRALFSGVASLASPSPNMISADTARVMLQAAFGRAEARAEMIAAVAVRFVGLGADGMHSVLRLSDEELRRFCARVQ